MGEETFPEWDRNPRRPTPAPPAGSCDCQFHIFGDAKKYPPGPQAKYAPPHASFEDGKGLLRTMGFSRGVIVFPQPYGTDNRLLIDTLEGMSADDRRNFRATCIVRDHVTDRELERLKGLGVIGTRFNFTKGNEEMPKKALARELDRLRELGWQARLHFDPPEFAAYSDVLDAVDDIPMVIDHMGRVDFAGALDQPAVKRILEKLRRDNWWLMLSNGNRMSAMDAGWDDAVPFGRLFAEAAPSRVVWGSDWPHIRWQKRTMVNDGDAVELMYRYVDNDPGMIRRILVDNPARLVGFA
jgi:2-pyrone-4,6-dicarboxylate lactonase